MGVHVREGEFNPLPPQDYIKKTKNNKKKLKTLKTYKKLEEKTLGKTARKHQDLFFKFRGKVSEEKVKNGNARSLLQLPCWLLLHLKNRSRCWVRDSSLSSRGCSLTWLVRSLACCSRSITPSWSTC